MNTVALIIGLLVIAGVIVLTPQRTPRETRPLPTDAERIASWLLRRGEYLADLERRRAEEAAQQRLLEANRDQRFDLITAKRVQPAIRPRLPELPAPEHVS
jgi:hypothetical protein